jgi:hypothetical protein
MNAKECLSQIYEELTGVRNRLFFTPAVVVGM